MKLLIAFIVVLSASSLSSQSEPVDQPMSEYQENLLNLERQKLENERIRSWITASSVAVSILIPLVIVILTLRSQAKSAFELKAAEIVLSSFAPYAAERRAAILRELFPRRLPKDFATQFNSKNFPGTLLHDMKMEIFRAIASNPEKKNDIIGAWKMLINEPGINAILGSATSEAVEAVGVEPEVEIRYTPPVNQH